MGFLNLEETLKAINGKVVIKGDSKEYNSVSTDTRKIQKGSIFIALKGENFNANEFAIEAIEKGAELCIVDEIKFNLSEYKGKGTIVLVEDTRRALLDLAKYYRSKLKVKVIGVTGSTGKTSTKDLIAAALSKKYNVFKTEGNFNNEIGLPLMIFKLNRNYDVAVLEMGMSNLGEIKRMADVARPDMAVITNIGISHIENLKTRENILKAKLEVTSFFNKENILIVNGENDLLKNLHSDSFNLVKISIDEKLDFNAEDIVLEEETVSFKVRQGEELSETVKIDVPGKHTVLNGLLAIACGIKMSISISEIIEGLKKLQTTNMRLDIIRGEKYNIINDCYNASPDSMIAALDVLKNIKSKGKIAILGTMGELGDEAYSAHKKVGSYAALNKVRTLISIGEHSESYKEGFLEEDGLEAKAFSSFEEAVPFIEEAINAGDTILVKASRAMKFERVVELLKKNNLR